MTTTAIRIGPEDHGRAMSLAEFEHADTQAGFLYELGQGVIVVSDVPNPVHFAQFNAIRRQFSAYDLEYPGRIHSMGGGGECKLLISSLESERHPDYAIYLSPPPSAQGEVWSIWVPDIVVEIVSPGSEDRDYVEKRKEYLKFGVREYWILDLAKDQLLALRRVGNRWRESKVKASEVYTTRLLPKFEFDCRRVFEAAREVGG